MSDAAPAEKKTESKKKAAAAKPKKEKKAPTAPTRQSARVAGKPVCWELAQAPSFSRPRAHRALACRHRLRCPRRPLPPSGRPLAVPPRRARRPRRTAATRNKCDQPCRLRPTLQRAGRAGARGQSPRVGAARCASAVELPMRQGATFVRM